MQNIRNSMSEETQALVSSSSQAAKKRRGKDTSTLDHQDVIDANDLAIRRLEEDYASVQKELEDLETLMKD